MSTGISEKDAERFRSFERERHDQLAVSYQAFFSPITALAIGPLLQAAMIQAGSRLLDVATGPGSVAAEAANAGARPVGVDLSPGMIELAKQSHAGIDFRVAEVEHLPFAEKSFDAVVCNFGLGHFPKPEAAVGECVRTLQPGGRIALSWWDDPSRQRIQGLFREAVAEVGATPPPQVPTGHSVFRFSDTDEFRRLLEGAGLMDINIRDHQTSCTIADVETLWRGGLGSLAVVGAAVAYQDAATQQAIRAAFERRAMVYQTPAGLKVPIAFKVGVGRRPT